MYLTPEQLQAATQAQVETALNAATSQLAKLEKLASLNADAARTAFESSLANTRALMGAKDLQQYIQLQSSFALPAIDRAMAYSKNLCEFALEANDELSRFSAQGSAQWNQNLAATLDSFAHNAPAGSDVAVAALKSVVAAANSAFDSLNTAARQATEIARANLAAASDAAKGFAAGATPG